MIRRRLVSGVVTNSMARATSFVMWFLLTPFMLRSLGPAEYALWILTGAVMSYGSLFDLGLGGAVVKYVAEHVARGERQMAREAIASSQWLYLGLAGVTLLVAAGVAPVLPALLALPPPLRETARWLIVLAGIDVAVSIAFMLPTAILKGLQRYDLYNAIQAGGTVLLGCVSVAILIAGGGVVALIAANIPVSIVTRYASAWLVRRIAPDLAPGWRAATRTSIRQMTGFSVPLFGISMSERLRSKSDEFIIAALASIGMVTPYVLARRLGEGSRLATEQILKIVMPLASELDAADRLSKLRRLYITSSRIALGVALPAAVVLAFAGGPILEVWVGPRYAQYGTLAALLGLTSVAAAAQEPAVEILKGMARHRLIAVAALIAGAINIALSMLLLPVLGLTGVALAGFIPTLGVACGVVIPLANRTLQVTWRRAMHEIWMPTLLPAAAAVTMLTVLVGRDIGASLDQLARVASAVIAAYAVVYMCMPAATHERALVRDAVRRLSCRARHRSPAAPRSMAPAITTSLPDADRSEPLAKAVGNHG